MHTCPRQLDRRVGGRDGRASRGQALRSSLFLGTQGVEKDSDGALGPVQQLEGCGTCGVHQRPLLSCSKSQRSRPLFRTAYRARQHPNFVTSPECGWLTVELSVVREEGVP